MREADTNVGELMETALLEALSPTYFEQRDAEIAKLFADPDSPWNAPDPPLEYPPMVVPISARLATLDALKAEDGILDGVKVILWKNDTIPTPYTLLADLVECNFTGYARSAALVWGAPYVNASQQGEMVAGSVQFTASGNTITNIVYGYAVITDDVTDLLQFAERFPEPIPVDGLGSAVVVLPRFAYPS